MTENKGKRVFRSFNQHAYGLGFNYQRDKVVGDYAFRKRNGDYIKLIGSRDEIAIVYRKGAGRYQIDLLPPN